MVNTFKINPTFNFNLRKKRIKKIDLHFLLLFTCIYNTYTELDSLYHTKTYSRTYIYILHTEKMSMNLKSIVSNPECIEFKERYVSLGKKDGKIKYSQDCRTFKVHMKLQGFQIIENGYSSRDRLAYANSEFQNNAGSSGAWNDTKNTRIGPSIDKEKERIDAAKAKKLLEIKNKLEDKLRRKLLKKKNKWTNEIEKMSKQENWDDDAV